MNVHLPEPKRTSARVETGQPLNEYQEWTAWPHTLNALIQTYYQNGAAPSELAYALAGLQRFRHTWAELHGHRNVTHTSLDRAAANECWYHYNRARQFRRPCAALAACWTALVCDRPERIFTVEERSRARAAREAKKMN